MNILGIDTALEACSVGLAIAGRSAPIIRSEIVERGQAERLFVLIEMACAEGGVGLGDVDRLAVTTGPGSFTGIRVGVAAVRGFALVFGARSLGFSTLAVHAESARREAGATPVLASLPAKAGDVFTQLFGPDGQDLSDPMVVPAGSAMELAVSAGAVLAGSGSNAVTAATSDSRLTVIHEESAPDIVSLLRLAEKGAPQDAATKPLYIKPPSAKPAPSRLARR